MSKENVIINKKHLEELERFFVEIAGGDLNTTLSIPSEENELSNTYVGIKLLLDTAKEKIFELEREIIFRRKILRKSYNNEKKYLDLYENSPDMLLSIAIDSKKILDCNNTLLKNLGYSKEEVKGRSIFDFYHPHYIPAVNESFKEFLTTGTISGLELFVKKHDGNYIPVLLKATAIKNKEGKIIATRSSWRDMSTEYSAKKALEESEKRYRALNNNAFDAIIMANHHGEIVSWNKGAEHIFQYTEEEVLNEDLTKIMPVRYRAKHSEGFLKHLTTGKKNVIGHVIELEGLRKNGEEFPIEISLSSWESDGKKFFSGIIRDITIKSMQERIIRQSEEKYRTLVQKMNEGVIMLNKRNQIYFVNNHFVSMLGYTHTKDILYKNLNQFTIEKDLSILQQCLETNESKEIQLYTKDGNIKWCQIKTSHITPTSDTTINKLVILNDIDHLKRANITQKQLIEQLKSANDETTRAMQTKERFMANMNHEIRTPLNGILGLTDLLLSTRLNARQREFLSTIKHSGDNLLELINILLDFSKMDAGELKLNIRSFNLKEIIIKSIKLYEVNASKKSIKLRYHIDSQIPEALIGDSVRINQILTNLISNSIKFTKEGIVDVDATLKHQENKICTIEFKISDTGQGIPKDALPYVFENFFQESRNNDITEGTGLGLAIVKKLVMLHGGDISVKSKLGKGTVFTFSIQCEIDEAVSNNSHRQDNYENQPLNLNVLVAEDNPVNQLLIKEMLAEWNCKVTITKDGNEVIEEIKKNPYDLILMDLMMPNLSGDQAAKIIREELNADIPIIVLTADTFRIQDKAISSLFNSYVIKPFQANQLHKTISEVTVSKEYMNYDEIIDTGKYQYINPEILEEYAGSNPITRIRLAKILIKQDEELIRELKILCEEPGNEKKIFHLIHKHKTDVEVLGNINLISYTNKIESLEDSDPTNENIYKYAKSYYITLEKAIDELQQFIHSK